MKTDDLLLVLGLVLIAMMGSACQATLEPVQHAQRICACLHPIDSLNQQLVVTLDQGKQEEAMEIMMDLDEWSQRVADCLDAGLPEDLASWPSEEVKTELDRQCPQWETMMRSLSGYSE